MKTLFVLLLAVVVPAWAQERPLQAVEMTDAPAPMPCDVMIYMRGMRLPELPASLVPRDDRPAR